MLSTQKKRDKRLHLVYVAQEQARIAEYRSGILTKTHEQKKEEYKKWCEDNKVENLLEE